MRNVRWLLCLALIFLLAGCFQRVRLFSDASDPLMEYILSGEGPGKVLLLSLDGVISDQPNRGVFSSKPSMVQDVVSQLDKASRDDEIKAVVLKINSPGGTVTASDILFHEIMEFKKRSKAKVLAVQMDVAASGGYYVSLAADKIIAHPTTITGSVGVIFLSPELYGLMDKIGVGVSVAKSGRNKDMGSPFRPATAEERTIVSAMIDDMAQRFLGLVGERRGITGEKLEEVATARIFTANQAKELGLVDELAHLPEALQEAKEMAGLSPEAEVVVYRRTEYPNDTVYNAQAMAASPRFSLVDLGLENYLPPARAGAYYLWLPQR
ncbi:MAG: signal peptide peptidase SppA [Desulfovibrionaceae bacterium]